MAILEFVALLAVVFILATLHAVMLLKTLSFDVHSDASTHDRQNAATRLRITQMHDKEKALCTSVLHLRAKMRGTRWSDVPIELAAHVDLMITVGGSHSYNRAKYLHN
jgi:hypothetical protein